APAGARVSFSTAWRDGDRVRTVELRPLGNGRWTAVVDGAPLEVEVEPLGAGRHRLVTGEARVIADVKRAGSRRFVRLGPLAFVVDREAARSRRARTAHDGGRQAPTPGIVTR